MPVPVHFPWGCHSQCCTLVVGAGPQAPGGAFTQEIPFLGGPVVNRLRQGSLAAFAVKAGVRAKVR